MKICFLCGIVLACLGACAQTQLNASADAPKQKEYRTGSNLPIGESGRSGVTVTDKDALQDQIRRTIPLPKPGQGG